MRRIGCFLATLVVSATASFPALAQAPGQPPPGWQPQPQPQPGMQPPPGWGQPQPQPGMQCAPGQPCPPPQPPPGWQPPPPQPPPIVQAPKVRDFGEMMYLYSTSAAYGVGMGAWIDVLANAQDPGVAAIAPIALGVTVPLGMFIWDQVDTFRPGVPASMATGMLFGLAEGVGISGTQVALTGPQKRWDLSTATTLTFVTTTVGGVGGFFFGRWLEPDPRQVMFISNTLLWGAGTGVMLGIGGSKDGIGESEKSSGDGAAAGALLGANIGIGAGAAAVIAGYKPSWQAQKWMWLGYGVGAAVPSFLYFFYIGSSNSCDPNAGSAAFLACRNNYKDPKHGLIGNALGGIAGLTLTALLTANMSDDDPKLPPGARSGKAWTPPFQLMVAPAQLGQGATISAFGTW